MDKRKVYLVTGQQDTYICTIYVLYMYYTISRPNIDNQQAFQ